MREDDQATEIANALSECVNACAMLCQKRPEAQRDSTLDAVSWFIEAAPLVDLPTVETFGIAKKTIRDAAVIAARLKAAVFAWDGAAEPPPSLVSLACEFLTVVGVDGILGTPVTKDGEREKS